MVSVERILSRLEVDITNCYLDLAKLRAKQIRIETPQISLQDMMEYNAIREKLRLLEQYRDYIKG